MAGFNWIVLLIGLVFAALAITVSIFVVIYWTHPEEPWGCGGVFSRIIVALSFVIVLVVPLFVPLDVIYQLQLQALTNLNLNHLN